MTLSETSGSIDTRTVLPTELPDVEVYDIREDDLQETENLFKRNIDHTAGEITSDEFLFEQVVRDVSAGGKSKNQHKIIKLKDTPIGYARLVPSEISFDPDDVEISYFVDKDHIKKGIAKAAIGALVKQVDETEHNVIAHVDPKNDASLNLLKRLGFEEHYDLDDNARKVLSRRALITRHMADRFGLM